VGLEAEVARGSDIDRCVVDEVALCWIGTRDLSGVPEEVRVWFGHVEIAGQQDCIETLQFRW